MSQIVGYETRAEQPEEEQMTLHQMTEPEVAQTEPNVDVLEPELGLMAIHGPHGDAFCFRALLD